jgi:hypothetical protein
MTFLSLSGSTDLDLSIVADGSQLGVGSGCNLGSIEVKKHHNAAILLAFWNCQAMGMAQSGGL